jgi:hypothetical protein
VLANLWKVFLYRKLAFCERDFLVRFCVGEKEDNAGIYIFPFYGIVAGSL